MVDRAVWLLALLAPLPVLAAFQGMLTVGLVPIALFGPLYAVARLVCSDSGTARVESVRLTAAATLGASLALLPALFFLRHGVTPIPGRLTGLALGLTAAGIAVLAGLANTPAPRALSREEKRRWTIVEALDPSGARGLAVLFFAALPLAVGIGLLREVPLFGSGAHVETLAEALFGARAIDGWVLIPGGEAWWLVAVPLSLAPVAMGFLLSPRQATPLVAGGVLAALAAPLVVWLGLPVGTPGGEWVPLDLRPAPAFEAFRVLAPAGLGVLVGAGCVHVGRGFGDTRLVPRVLWAAAGALVVLVLEGALPALVLALGVVVAGFAVSWSTHRAPLGVALGVGALFGLLFGNLATVGEGLAIGTLIGIVVGGAVVTARSARTLLLPRESLRSPVTLLYVAVGVAVAGVLAWAAASHVGSAPFRAPHALGLASGLEALLTGRGDLLLTWGIVAGAFVQWGVGRGALVGLGFLVGPGVAALVLVGSLLRAAWENLLLERAREGFVMRGELGYELLRVHALVVAVLAGEAIALAVASVVA